MMGYRYSVNFLYLNFIALSVVFSALGGFGGSFQLSRILLIPILMLVIFRWVTKSSIYLRGIKLSLQIFVMTLITLGWVSLIWSIDRVTSLGYLLTLMVNLSPLAILIYASDKKIQYLQWIVPRAWLIAAIAVIPFGFYELITGSHFDFSVDERGGIGADILPFASGLHGNFNNFSLYLLFCLWGIFFIKRSSETHRYLNIFFKVMTVLAILIILAMNTSRGVIFAVIILLIAQSLLIFQGKSIIGFISLIIIVCGGMVFYSDDNLFMRYLFLKFSDFSYDFQADEGRWNILMAGISGLISTYGLGGGAGTSSILLAKNAQTPIPNPHNLVLEWVLDFGIFGLFILIWFVVTVWNFSNKLPNRNHALLIKIFIVLMPIFGVVQSHILGYTYFWLMLFTIVLQSISVRNSANYS
jgi:hypothetical protein